MSVFAAVTAESAFVRLLQLAFDEDLGLDGDVTSAVLFADADRARAELVSKQAGVLCGSRYFTRAFDAFDARVSVEWLCNDGAPLAVGQVVATVVGPTRSILATERIALNFLGYLSGIAGAARRFAEPALGSRTRILDTRKTLPGYRALAKEAVRAGGAANHRQGLYDMVMIKDNHIDAAGGITPAVRAVRRVYGSRFAVEVECRNLTEVREAIDNAVDVIMLDNMPAELCAEAVGMTTDATFEASGNMTLARIPAYVAVGVDSISVGALTHSVSVHDFSLRVATGDSHRIEPSMPAEELT